MNAPLSAYRHLSSLRWRFAVALSGAVLACTAVCIAAAVIFLSQALVDRSRSDLQHTLSGVSGYVDNQRHDLLGIGELIAADPAVQSSLRTHNQQSLIVHLTPIYADLNADVMDIVDAHGQVLVRMEATLVSGDRIGNRLGSRHALAGHEGTALENDLPGREAAGGYALRAFVPIRRGSRVVGVVVVGRQLGTIFAERIGRALSADVNLIAGNQLTGTTLRDSQGLPITGLPVPVSVLARVQTGKVSIASVQENGGPVLSGLVPLQDAGGRWIGAVEVVRPVNPVFDVIRRLSLLLLVLGILVVALGIVLALAISRRLTSRLSVLEAIASRIAGRAKAGEPLHDMQAIPSVTGKDEVASLARSFSSMMTALDERMAANAELYEASQERVRELSGLAEIARLLTDVSSVRATMDTLSEHVCRLVSAAATAIWLPGQEARPALHGGHGLPEMYERLSTSIVVQADSLGVETAAQMALRTGRVERRNILDEPSIEGSDQAVLLAELQSLGWVWAVAVPLRVQSRVVGAMTCYMRPEEGLSDSDLSLLTTIADQVAVAVENARLAADAQKRAALEERLQAQDVLEKRVAAIAIENARLYKQAQAVAVLEERQRLARELHDSVSQALYAVALGAKTAHALLPRDPDGTAEALDYVLVQAEAGLTEMRALIFELRPQALESEGLIAALRQQVETVRVRHRIDVRAVLGAEPGISLDVKEALYRIAQEAVHNTVKHARARSIEIRLLEDAEGITLEVRDDGKGFEPDGSFPGHLGLRTMRERALRLGGTLNVTSAPGEGTSIRAVLPHTERRNESPAAEAG